MTATESVVKCANWRTTGLIQNSLVSLLLHHWSWHLYRACSTANAWTKMLFCSCRTTGRSFGWHRSSHTTSQTKSHTALPGPSGAAGGNNQTMPHVSCVISYGKHFYLLKWCYKGWLWHLPKLWIPSSMVVRSWRAWRYTSKPLGLSDLWKQFNTDEYWMSTKLSANTRHSPELQFLIPT